MADKWIYIVVSLLMGMGLVFSYSLPIYLETIHDWGEFYFFNKFLIFAMLGILIMYLLSQCFPDKCVKIIGFTLFGVGGILIMLMATPFLDAYCPTIKGAKRWIKIFGFTISPIEFFKIGIIYFFAWGFARKLIDKRKRTFKEEFKVIFPYILILSLVAIFVVIFQSDLGQVMLIFFLFLSMLIFTNTSGKMFLSLIISFFTLGIVSIYFVHYRMERVRTNLNMIYNSLPDFIKELFPMNITTNDISYQIRQSINAIYNGGFLGKGIGNGEFKMGYLSDVHTDFVLSGISEEIGFLGISLVIMLILGLIFRIFKIANRIEEKTIEDTRHKFFVIGIGLLIGFETILNTMGIVGLFPLKGLPIPFVSYGGSAIISFSIAIGMVLMISKKAKL